MSSEPLAEAKTSGTPGSPQQSTIVPANAGALRWSEKSEGWTSSAIRSGDFNAYQLAIMHDWLGTLTLLATVLVPLFYILDLIVAPATLHGQFALYRGISTVLALVQVIIVRRTTPSRWSFAHGYAISFQVGAFIALMTTQLGGFGSAYYAGLNLVMIGVNLLMPWRAAFTAINSLLIVALYIGFNLAAGSSFNAIGGPNNLFFLFATAVIATSISYVRFRLIRKEFSLLVEVRRARDEIAATSGSLRSLLDVSGQGFLSFDADFLVQPEYSLECENIFGGPIAGNRVDELLFPAPSEREDFRQGCTLFFSGSSKPEVIFDLLDHRLAIGEKTVRAEYRAIGTNRIMMVLTDITEQVKREAEAEEENHRTALLMKVIANRPALGAFVRSVRPLFARLTSRDCDYDELLREIHTVKGDAGFLQFTRTQAAAHDLETFLSDRLVLGETIVPDEPIRNLRRVFDRELAVVADSLGPTWLARSDAMEIGRPTYERLLQYAEEMHPDDDFLRESLADIGRTPLRDLFARYPDMILDLAARTGKRVAPITISGGEFLVDPGEFDDLVSSFTHLVRNMVDHGIEHPGVREERGKPPAGQLKIEIGRASGRVTFRFFDDGDGIALDDIEETARRKGLLKDGVRPSRNELLSLIFSDRFSTAKSVSTVSGRGVGLAAVREAVRRRRGHITVKTTQGHGTAFTISVPATIPVKMRVREMAVHA